MLKSYAYSGLSAVNSGVYKAQAISDRVFLILDKFAVLDAPHFMHRNLREICRMEKKKKNIKEYNNL